jgi:restriction system protein
MYELDPIKFEFLVALLLEDAGYSVKVTPASRDGGRDILAVLKIPFGEVLTIVDCKRFAAHRKIGPELVQRLLWVSDNHDRASNAMLVTTSSFTSGARLIEQEHRWRLKLQEYGDIHDWLSRFGKWRAHDTGSLWLPGDPQNGS